MDVLFNSVSADLNLSNGAVSKSILQGAGHSIQLEVLSRSPNGLQPGQFVTSSGGNLNCKLIFHTALNRWDQGQGMAEQVFYSIIFITILLLFPKSTRKNSLNFDT